MEDHYRHLINEGISALKVGNTAFALLHFQEASALGETPELFSHFAYCLAKEKNEYSRAISLCKKALAREPWNSVHYLNLGYVYLLSGQKRDAIYTFRDGLLHEENPQLREELARLGTRKQPLIASLPRDHVLNKYLGMFLARLKLR
jgi:Flp pilus assembly protein TadD